MSGVGSFVGIDLGGTKIRGVLADGEGRILASRQEPTGASEGSKAVFATLASIAASLVEEGRAAGRAPLAVGVGAPGPLDAERGIILVTENLPFVDFPLGPSLEARLGLPVKLDNDGCAAAMGEYLYGAGRGADPLVYVTASTGIGGGAIIGGRPLRGRGSNALEVGHMTLLPEGPECKCGNRGCAEALASGTAIAARAEEAVLAASSGGRPTSLSSCPRLGAEEVFREAGRGDAVAELIVSEALAYLGICVANLATLFDPELIVIGGGLCRSGERLFEAVRLAVRSRCSKAVSGTLRILPAGLGEDSGALGAAALAAQAACGDQAG
jgi:glucokinase